MCQESIFTKNVQSESLEQDLIPTHPTFSFCCQLPGMASIGVAASVKRRRRASKEKDGLEETQGEERKQGGACKGMEIDKG